VSAAKMAEVVCARNFFGAKYDETDFAGNCIVKSHKVEFLEGGVPKKLAALKAAASELELVVSQKRLHQSWLSAAQKWLWLNGTVADLWRTAAKADFAKS